jgi:prophage DNA circulation protein
MVTYSFTTRMPSLWMVQRLYTDASRNDELIAENKPIHPLFMPSSGVALSA